jgi:hypothetical protein
MAILAEIFVPLGRFILSLTLAMVGTAILETPFVHVTHPLGHSILREDCLSAATAFGLGVSVSRIWKSSLGQWIWIAGMAWFVVGATLIHFKQQLPAVWGGTHTTVFSQLMGWNCELDIRSCESWLTYTLPSLRVVLYSVGTICYLSWRRTGNKNG